MAPTPEPQPEPRPPASAASDVSGGAPDGGGAPDSGGAPDGGGAFDGGGALDAGGTREIGPPARPQPRFGRFLLTGAVLGFLIALVVALLAPRTAAYSWTDLLIYLGLLAVLVGALLGGLVAVLLDRTPKPARVSPSRGGRTSRRGT